MAFVRTHRRFQFGLRVVLVGIAFFGIVLSWYSSQGQRQRRAVSHLRNLNARIAFDEDLMNAVPLPSKRGGWLRNIIGDDCFREPRQLTIRGAHVTDNDVAVIGTLVSLDMLSLRYTAVTDTGLESLTSLKQLKYLDLEGTDITDKSVEVLSKLTDLTFVNLANTRVSMDGLDRLKSALPSAVIWEDVGLPLAIIEHAAPGNREAEGMLSGSGDCRPGLYSH